MGRLVGDILQCHYHGLRYDATGACVRVPGQDTIPPGACVKAYPVVERHRWLWIWMGDPALADPAAIADFHWLDDPAWGAKTQYLHVQANWQLIVDNLLDLTHLAFVHETTIGNSALVDNANVKVERAPSNVVGHPLDHRRAGAADLRQGRRLYRECRPLADHSTSCHRRSCASTSAARRPAPVRRRVAASAASTCAISMR
jgi:phenylpropionate dioxygenase-like ring-hydroxylating dioxygenase large terminal subunit